MTDETKPDVKQQLTGPLRDIINGPVTDGRVAGLNVHEGLASDSHGDHLLHAQGCNA